ncbi:MAG: Gfo/Idh/MocA family oxidoreductase [Chitinophagaceae bacterium]|nr:Gfo/Idh/MocA family oxidoreductase [Chitinophagaceae bacterium]
MIAQFFELKVNFINSNVHFSLIGCGRIGHRHAELISQFGELAAVCDVIQDRAEEIAHRYNVPAYTKCEEMFASHPETDVVVVCTPNGLHAVHTVAALKAGFHVLCEKPMAIHVHDCGEMINTADKMNKRLFIVKQNRFNPPVVAVKKTLDEGRLGKIYSIQLNCFWNRDEAYYSNSWKGTKDLDGGTLFTQFSHFIDLMYWMIGDVKKVHAILHNYHHQGIIEFEDTGVATLEFENGVIGTLNYSVNSFEKNMEGSLTIFGEKGTVKIGGQYLNELEYQEIKDYEITGLPPGNPPNNYGHYVGSMSNHDKVYQNVIDVLQNGASVATSGFEGMKTVEIIEKIYRRRD